MKGEKVAALVSGGVESAALIQRLVRRGQRVQPIYVRQGFRWETAEQAWLRRLLCAWPRTQVAPLVVLEMPARSFAPNHWALKPHGPVPGSRSPDQAMYLPGRNLFLYIAAGVWCAQRGIRHIAHGTLATNPFSDASPDWFRGMSLVLTRGLAPPLRRGAGFQLEAPLRQFTKPEIVRQLHPQLLRLTFSCVNPRPSADGRGRHCGRCNKCAERRHAFHAARLPDPTRYAA